MNEKNYSDIDIVPMRNGFIGKTYDIFKNFSQSIKIDEFRAIYYKNNLKERINLLQTNINIALYRNKYVYGYYIFHISLCDFYYVDQIVIPGPLGRQTILKKFIEYFVKDALENESKIIFINNICNKDWEYIFFKELGAKDLDNNKLRIDL
ncbi:MAG: hypothetical protein HOF44_06760 [Pelagibacterales bacterium]|nr:hypothetical protein [Pelagibacterales bacterium]